MKCGSHGDSGNKKNRVLDEILLEATMFSFSGSPGAEG